MGTARGRPETPPNLVQPGSPELGPGSSQQPLSLLFFKTNSGLIDEDAVVALVLIVL